MFIKTNESVFVTFIYTYIYFIIYNESLFSHNLIPRVNNRKRGIRRNPTELQYFHNIESEAAELEGYSTISIHSAIVNIV